MTKATNLQEILRTRRVVVCVGTGGVGKTTIAAALAIAAARSGRRALVVTIDPARRLADALGGTDLGNDPREITGDPSIETSNGSLHAVMLDPKSTLDDMVERFSSSPEARDRILDNRIYQHISGALAGSSEYAAMERVSELLDGGDFDILLVDTPPAQHAFDFLDAPRRLLEFFESRIVQVLVQPALRVGRLGLGVFQRGTRRLISLIEGFSGLSFLEDLSDFLLAFDEISTRFQNRAVELRRVLTGPESAFVLVGAPRPDLSQSGAALLERLISEGAPLAGVIINRMRTWPGGGDVPKALVEFEGELRGTDRLAERLPRSSEPRRDRAKAAIQAAREYALGVTCDRHQVAELREAAVDRHLFFQWIPQLERDVHDLGGLDRVVHALFDPANETRHD